MWRREPFKQPSHEPHKVCSKCPNSIHKKQANPLRHVAAAISAQHRPSVVDEDPQCHCLQQAVCQRPRAERRQFMCADSACSESAPCYRRCTEMSSSTGCCTPTTPGGDSLRWRFTTVADRQHIEGFLRHGVRASYRRADEPTAEQLVENSDDQLFQ